MVATIDEQLHQWGRFDWYDAIASVMIVTISSLDGAARREAEVVHSSPHMVTATIVDATTIRFVASDQLALFGRRIFWRLQRKTTS